MIGSVLYAAATILLVRLTKGAAGTGVGMVTERQTDLGAQHDLGTILALDGLADQLLRVALAVDGRGIDQVDAVIQRGAQRVDALLVLDGAEEVAAHCPGARTNGGHDQVAVAKLVHSHKNSAPL